MLDCNAVDVEFVHNAADVTHESIFDLRPDLVHS